MALFSKDSQGSDGRSAIEASLSIIAAGMRITGDVESGGVIKIDGRVEGSVTGARQIMLGRGGAIHGNVQADEVVIGGDVFGAVSAGNRLELQGTAVVNGDIDTKSIVVLEGAQINGTVRMSDVSGSAGGAIRGGSISMTTR